MKLCMNTHYTMNKNNKNQKRIELQLTNVSAGELKRVSSTLEKNLNIDEYVFKAVTKSVIVNKPDILESVKRLIKSVDEKILIVEKEVKNMNRYIFYLENLDCANCAMKVERLCAKAIECEKVIVDFATLKIVIETSKKYSELELQLKIQECAEMVDPRIDTKKTLKETKQETFKINKKDKINFIIGFSIFLIIFIAKTIIINGFNIEDTWVTILIYCGYVPAYLLLAKDVLYGAYINLKNARFFDEKFLMTLATIMALCVGYYDEALILIVFFRIGDLCQQVAVNYSRKSIAGLASIQTDTAIVEINGQRVEMEAEGVVVGDILFISSGQKIALDGIVVEGSALLDAQAITGESKSVEVGVNDEVLSGSIVIDGAIKLKVTKSYENSMAAKILEVVNNASSLKSKSETIIAKFAKFYTPIVVLLAFIIAVFLPLVNHEAYTLDWQGYRESLRVAMIFLVVSCPCALVISIPLGFFGGIGCASKKGILIKGSNYLEAINDAKIIIFDKTGTLTKGTFSVTEVKSVSDFSDDEILTYAAMAETTSNHVIAQSILKAYGKPIDSSLVTPINLVDKRGILAKVNEKLVALGRRKFIENLKIKIPTDIFPKEVALENVMLVAINDKIAGYIIIEDEIREESYEVISQLNKKGIKTIMITGDGEKTAREVSRKLSINEFYSDVNPLQKVDILLDIKKKHPNNKIMFVGDGLNDAPVISVADIGVAIGGFGGEATMQIADVVLMNEDIKKVITSIDIAKKTKKILIQNIIFALVIKIIFLVVAPMNIINNILIYGAIFADVGVSLLAVLNSLRTMRLKK